MVRDKDKVICYILYISKILDVSNMGRVFHLNTTIEEHKEISESVFIFF